MIIAYGFFSNTVYTSYILSSVVNVAEVVALSLPLTVPDPAELSPTRENWLHEVDVFLEQEQ